jgi:Dynamin family/Dynamin central region
MSGFQIPSDSEEFNKARDPPALETADPTALNQMSLKLVDELRHCLEGISNGVELPQIIVCGNQSSGKSSVLEGISGLNFPRDSGLCTTFPTELRIYRGEQNGGTVSLPSSSGIQFHVKLHKLADFGKAIQDAKTALKKHYGKGEKAIFRHVLRVEVTHRTWPPLTLVDLPGLTKNPVYGQTKEDVALIREIVEGYMSNSKAIIMAVIHGKDDLANQEVLTMAKERDSFGKRTIGVITKPDCITAATQTEADFLRIASYADPEYKFKHWHVVRSRAFGENCSLEEHKNSCEARFFGPGGDGEVWAKSLDEEQLGIDALRTKLGTILELHVRQELPGVKDSLYKQLKTCRAALTHLGPARVHPHQKEEFLSQISQKFVGLIEQSTTGRYYGEENILRLRASVEEQNDYFAWFMYQNGHSYEEKTSSDTTSTQQHFPISENIARLPDCSPQTLTHSEFVDKVRAIRRKYRGQDWPGFYNSDHLNMLFRKQSEPWKEIAEAHVNNIWSAAVGTVNLAIEKVSEGRTAQKLKDYLIQGVYAEASQHAHIRKPSDLNYSMEAIREDLLAKLDEILSPYKKLHVVTRDPEYTKQASLRSESLAESERQSLSKHLAFGEPVGSEEYIHQKLSSYQPMPQECAMNPSQVVHLMQVWYRVSHPPNYPVR